MTMRILTLCLIVLLSACSSETLDDAGDRVLETAEDVRREGSALLAGASASGELRNDFEGTYRLQSMFRGEQECLDANYHDADTHHGGAFMAPCDGSDDQTWQLTPVDPGHYQIWTEHDGERLCLDGNDRESPIHEGAAFAEPCRLIAGQIWSIAAEENGFARLHTEFYEHSACLESNAPGSQRVHSGAAYMDACQNVTGQLWRLVRLDAPPV